mgnify:CR=1 FL=1
MWFVLGIGYAPWLLLAICERTVKPEDVRKGDFPFWKTEIPLLVEGSIYFFENIPDGLKVFDFTTSSINSPLDLFSNGSCIPVNAGVFISTGKHQEEGFYLFGVFWLVVVFRFIQRPVTILSGPFLPRYFNAFSLCPINIVLDRITAFFVTWIALPNLLK